jgi:superfamily II DNA/RNA helicase
MPSDLHHRYPSPHITTTSVKSYVHRIGRTARGGARGAAVSLVAPDEEALLARCMRHQTPKDRKFEDAADGTGDEESQLRALEFRVQEVRNIVWVSALFLATLLEFKYSA